MYAGAHWQFAARRNPAPAEMPLSANDFREGGNNEPRKCSQHQRLIIP
jgi:hypothetical protein